MRTGTFPYALDLESQIQLLSRLQFLTRFSTNLIQVTGPEGAGKTWLSQRYLEQWAAVPQQALLLCHPQQTDAQHRAFLLQQLVPKAVFNEHDPIVDSIARIFSYVAVNMVIVIDDAHHLSPAIVAELWVLVQQARELKHWQINVLLFGYPNRLDTYLEKITHGQDTRALDVEIAPLSNEEALAFVDACVTKGDEDVQQRRATKARITQCAPWPGALMKLEQGESQNMDAQRTRRPSPLTMLIGVMALFAVVMGGWFLSPEPADSMTVTTPVVEQTSVLEQATALPHTVASDEGSALSPSSSAVQDDTASLPPEMHLEGLTVGRSDDNPRLVVPSDVVDAMLDEQHVGGSGEHAAAALTSPQMDSATETTESVPAPMPEPSPEPAPTAVPVASVTLDTVSPVAEPVSRVELGHELREVPPAHYALQLAAMQSIAVARNFIDEYEIHDLAVAYETLRNDRLWYIIVTGNYPDMQTARQAEQRLPANVRALKPWVKSYGQIHREMDRAK
ncbi:AAA family ATPase [Photobacterium japonica]|uniref:AAA family ATPase n=1 Tax=Photobacterium japonica TaxID=2910235 RepID=UPI003D0A0D2E